MKPAPTPRLRPFRRREPLTAGHLKHWVRLLTAKRIGWRRSLSRHVADLANEELWLNPSGLTTTVADDGTGYWLTAHGPDGATDTLFKPDKRLVPPQPPTRRELRGHADEDLNAVLHAEARQQAHFLNRAAADYQTRAVIDLALRARCPAAPPLCIRHIKALKSAPHGPDFNTCATDNVRVGVPAAA